MGTIIKEANAEKLEGQLAEANGRAERRTIDTFWGLADIAAKAERAVQERTFLPKSDQVGARVSYRMSLDLPNSYRYRPDYTHIVLERRSTGWALVSASREVGDNKQAERIDITLTQGQAEEARGRFEAGFRVAE